MSCTEKSARTPNGLHVEVRVESDAGNCKVKAGVPGTHTLRITNRSFIRFTIDAHFECDTNCVRFSAYGELSSVHSPGSISIGPRPGKGKFQRTEAVDLTSRGSGADQIVRTEVTWTPIGWSLSTHDTLHVRVNTL